MAKATSLTQSANGEPGPEDMKTWRAMFPWRAIIIVFLILTTAMTRGVAGTIRVVNLAFDASATNTETQIRQTSAAIEKAGADVVILSGARDRQMCQQLALALKPADYFVAICSAFPTQTDTSSGRQIAILAKNKAYMAWAESWKVPAESGGVGGFAFAALRIGGHRLGVFAAQLDDAAVPGGSATVTQSARRQQWAQAVASLRNWVTNKIEAGVVGIGPGADPGSALESLFTPPFDRPQTWPVARRPAARENGTAPVFLEPRKGGLPALVISELPAVCELDLDSEPPPVAQVEVKTASPSTDRETANVLKQSGKSASAHIGGPSMNQVLAVGLPLLSVILIAIGMVLRKRTARAVVPAVESAAGSATPTYTLTLSHEESRPADGISIASTGVLMRVETPSEGEPSIEALRERAWLAEQRERQATNALRHAMFPHFSRWLREKVFKTLIADRRRLLETQRHAASKVEKVEERLARVELQLQQQIAGYETRIEQLLRELSAAREENRGIILAHIAQLRQEIQATRARARAQQQAGRNE